MRTIPAVFALVLAGFAALAADTPAVRSEGPTQRPGAAEAVSASLDIERTLLKEDTDAWAALASRLDQARDALQATQTTLDAAMRSETPVPIERIDQLISRIESEASDLHDAIAAERSLIDQMRERRRKILLLEDKVNTLLSRSSEATGPMSGTWDISLLPGGQRGRLFLTQTGTVISGTYVLDGGYSGSVQGTFVNRKIVLERIDSRLGRWGRLEGSLANDGSRIRGTWLRLELAGGDGGEGQWTATRATSQP